MIAAVAMPAGLRAIGIGTPAVMLFVPRHEGRRNPVTTGLPLTVPEARDLLAAIGQALGDFDRAAAMAAPAMGEASE